MNVQFTVHAWAPALIGLSTALLFATTFFVVKNRLNHKDQFGFGLMLTIILYAVFWVIPSILAWAIYATWWKP